MFVNVYCETRRTKETQERMIDFQKKFILEFLASSNIKQEIFEGNKSTGGMLSKLEPPAQSGRVGT